MLVISFVLLSRFRSFSLNLWLCLQDDYSFFEYLGMLQESLAMPCEPLYMPSEFLDMLYYSISIVIGFLGMHSESFGLLVIV